MVIGWFTAGAMDHSHYDCFVLAVLSHGDHRNVMFGVDGNVFTLEKLMEPIKLCQTLARKPKICIIEVNCLSGFFGSSSSSSSSSLSVYFGKTTKIKKDSSDMWKCKTCISRV